MSEGEVAATQSEPLLGWLTDRMVQAPSVRTYQRPGYTLIQTPAYPGYWFGNALFLIDPPSPASVTDWLRVWEQEFSGQSERKTAVLQWEIDRHAPDWLGAEEPLRVDGWDEPLKVENVSVRVLRTPRSPRVKPPVLVRPIETDDEWEQVLALVLAETEPTDGKRRQFHRWRFEEYRRQIRDGSGHWWGAFRGIELWGAAGFFWRQGLARFQEVFTAQPVRRQGVCSCLVHKVATDYLDRYPNGTVVIAAEHNSPAESLYTRLGFREVSRQWSVIAKRG